MNPCKHLILGIDPDTDKSGICTYWKENGQRRFKLYSLTFFELFDYLIANKHEIKIVIVEAGWLVKKSNYREKYSKTNVSTKIGKDVGSNHEAGRKIVEMCDYLEIPCTAVRPLKKSWKGTDGKITHKEFINLTGTDLKRTNQEERDSLLLVWGR